LLSTYLYNGLNKIFIY